MKQLRILVTGGAGFIGSNLVEYLLGRSGDVERVVVLDKLTYAGNLENLSGFEKDDRFRFVQGDILDRELVEQLLKTEVINRVMHLAAESHVDRSIMDANDFVQTNVVGTQRLLEAAVLRHECEPAFRFLHVSTDEVYGSLEACASACSEISPYAPNSPYAASKAASDHLVRAWNRTHGLPTVITNSANNLGPRQHREKLIPLLVDRLVKSEPLPIYGDGSHVRDWMWVGDHCEALCLAMEKGRVGESYNIGSGGECSNLEMANRVIDLVGEIRPELLLKDARPFIEFVEDRPGHDRRYAVDAEKLRRETGWAPKVGLEEALERTVRWYLNATSAE